MEMTSEAIKANMKALREGRSIVPINENGLYTPIFSISSYSKMKELSSHLGHNQPFYCFTPTSIETPSFVDIHEKVPIYLKEIKAVRPEGPYILSAFCGQHFLIFEIAQELIDQGEKVPLIVLFESYRPIALSPNSSIQYQIRRIKSNYNKISTLSLINGIKSISGLFKRKLNTLNFLASKNKSRKLIVKKFKSIQADQKLIENYKGNVLVFKASKSLLHYNNYPDMGWREFVKGDLKIIEVKGDHKTILKKPSVVDLAYELSEVLKEYN